MKLIYRNKKIEQYAQFGKISHELFHDILNPITGLILYLEMLDNTKTEKFIHNQIQEIKDSSENVRVFLKMIQNNLLNPQKKELINIDQEINRIIKLIYNKARKNNVSINHISNIKERIVISKIDLYQLMINLISNSIDAFDSVKDKRKRKINIKSEQYKTHIEISVSDNGCGIHQKEIKKIFKNGYTNKNQGFGIGLKTVKNIVIKNRGKIEVLSLNPQQKTQFIIKLPKNH